MTYEAVVFDLDGTLTDSAPGIMASTRYALETMRLPVPPETVMRSFLGPPLAESFMRCCGMSKEQAVEVTGHYRERYHATGWLENQVYPGIRPLLSALRQAGARLSVATGKPQEASIKILEHFGLAGFFDSIIGPQANDYLVSKRDMISLSLEGFQGRAVMIGDRDIDIYGARQVGIDSIGVAYGYGSREELGNAQPAALVSSVDELYELLGISKSKQKGFFISFEGNDGCGKSTQVEKLGMFLRSFGYDVLLTREPGGSNIAERIRTILLDPQTIGMSDMTEAYLYGAARAQHVREVVLPALDAGRIVISDRYVDSSVAYQGAGRQLGMRLVEQLNAPAIDGCLPDLTILLDIDARAAMQRRQIATGADRIEMQSDAFHARVEQGFHQLAKENSERYAVISANADIETIAGRVTEIVLARLREADLF